MRYVIPPKIAFLQVFFQIALLTTLLEPLNQSQCY